MVELIDEADVGAADAGALHVGEMRGGDRIDVDFAGVGVLEQPGDVQERRFAGAGGRDQRHRLAGPHRELGALENVERGVALAKTPADAVQEDDRMIVSGGASTRRAPLLSWCSSIARGHS